VTRDAYRAITYSVADHVATLTLNRPAALNSFDSRMHDEVAAAMKAVRGDAEVRCLLLTGAGRGFCAGQDLGEREVAPGAEPPDLGETLERRFLPLIRAITGLDKPVVCAVNGVAAGVGASIALACDIVLAARSASFVQAFIHVGLVPDSGGTWNLPRAVGLPRARGLALLGDKLPAEQAAAWGLIWECVDDARLLPAARALAARLVALPARGLAMTKQLLNASTANSLHEQLEREREVMRVLGHGEDYREGVRAFLEKRKPVFTGK